MKNISISNETYKRLQKKKKQLGLKHYSDVIRWLFNHQLLKELATNETTKTKKTQIHVLPKEVTTDKNWNLEI